jgi:hypothetical protein
MGVNGRVAPPGLGRAEKIQFLFPMAVGQEQRVSPLQERGQPIDPWSCELTAIRLAG